MINKIENTLFNKSKEEYEKFRTEAINEMGYKKFRDLQNKIFRKLNFQLTYSISEELKMMEELYKE